MRRGRAIVGIFAAFCALACNAEPRSSATGGDALARERPIPEVDPLFAGVPALVSDTLWRFPSGVTVPSRMRAAIEYIGRIDDVGGPYLLASGVECNYCDASLSVLLQQAADSIGFLGRTVPGWYVYPGPIRSTGNDSIMLVTRLFWGRCLDGRGPGLLQFATEYDSVGAFQRRILRLTEVRNGRLVDDSVMVSPPDTSDVRRRIHAGTCREIPPREQMDL